MPELRSQMSGTITKVLVKVGDKIKEDQDVVGMESMKMEMFVQADRAGMVEKIHASVGAFVNEGDILITLK